MTEQRNNEAAPGDEPGALPRAGRRESDPCATGCDCTPVGIAEIAERLGVRRQTVDMWRYRGVLPSPRWSVGGRPAWELADVVAWYEARSATRVPSGPSLA